MTTSPFEARGSSPQPQGVQPLPQYTGVPSVANTVPSQAAPAYMTRTPHPMYGSGYAPSNVSVGAKHSRTPLLLAAAAAFLGFLLAALGAVLPLLMRAGKTLSLVAANFGAGFALVGAALLAGILIVIGAVKHGHTGMFLALLGGFTATFVTVFALTFVFGADATRILDAGGLYGPGAFLMAGGGVVLVVGALFALVASSRNSQPALTGQALGEYPAGNTPAL